MTSRHGLTNNQIRPWARFGNLEELFASTDSLKPVMINRSTHLTLIRCKSDALQSPDTRALNTKRLVRVRDVKPAQEDSPCKIIFRLWDIKILKRLGNKRLVIDLGPSCPNTVVVNDFLWFDWIGARLNCRSGEQGGPAYF